MVINSRDHNVHLKIVQHLRNSFYELLGVDITEQKFHNSIIYENYLELFHIRNLPSLYMTNLLKNNARLIDGLKAIKLRSESDFIKYKGRLLRNSNRGSFYGDVFEVFFYKSLIDKGINFINRESPDFEIYGFAETVYIECASSKVDQTLVGNPYSKINKSLRSKRTKKYANRKTGLFVDITNVFSHAVDNDEIPSGAKLSILGEKYLEETQYGLIVFMYLAIHLDKDKGPINIYTPHIVKSPEISKSLKDFIETNTEYFETDPLGYEFPKNI